MYKKHIVSKRLISSIPELQPIPNTGLVLTVIWKWLKDFVILDIILTPSLCIVWWENHIRNTFQILWVFEEVILLTFCVGLSLQTKVLRVSGILLFVKSLRMLSIKWFCPAVLSSDTSCSFAITDRHGMYHVKSYRPPIYHRFVL